MNMKYKRILLKLSGEALMGKKQFGIDNDVLMQYANEIKNISGLGVEIGIVRLSCVRRIILRTHTRTTTTLRGKIPHREEMVERLVRLRPVRSKTRQRKRRPIIETNQTRFYC